MEQLPSTSVKKPSTVIAEDVPDALEVNTVLSVEEVDKKYYSRFQACQKSELNKTTVLATPYLRRNSFRSADLAGRSCSRRTAHFY